MSNQAAWLAGPNQQLRVADAEMPKPDADEVVIKNKAVAVNPVDWMIQDTGVFVQQWPAVLGCDSAGEVAEVGSNVKHLKKGDRVIGHAYSLATQQPKHGAFQLYTTTFSAVTAKIPDSLGFTEASVLPLAIDTAATGLFQSRQDGFIGLEYPTLTPTQSGKTLVVYGGSSSVGALAIQLAVASGAHVITVSSERNLDFCKACGASEAFDYNSPSVVDEVVKAIQSADSSNFVGVYDAISKPDSYKITVPILEHIGAGNLVTTLPGPKELPQAIKTATVYAVHPSVYPLWDSFITPALERSKLKALPPPLVIGKGLESLQKGCDQQKKGVSARKVVVEL